MAVNAWRSWASYWKGASDPDEAGELEFARSLAGAGVVLLVSMCVLRVTTVWRLGAWWDEVTDIAPLRIKFTVILAIPTWYFAFVAVNALALSGRGVPATSQRRVKSIVVLAFVASAASAVLFWALPAWLHNLSA